MDHEEFMQEALKEAALARDTKNWAVGCVITLDDKIIARGRNRVFTDKNRLLHAEMDAITQLQEQHFSAKGKDLTLYTTLEPCPMCFGAILLAGIHTIVAGTNIDKSGASAYMDNLPEFFQQSRFKTTLLTGVLEDECAKMWLSGSPTRVLLERDRIQLQTPNRPQAYITTVRESSYGLTKSDDRTRRASKRFSMQSLKILFSTTK